MEVTNPVPPKYNPSRKDGVTGDLARNIYTGSVLIVAGIIWMLYNVDVISSCAFDVIFSWQMLLVAIGGFLLSQRNWTAGAIVSGFGVVFLLTHFLDIDISFHKIILPAILIAVGLAVLFGRKK